jgi:hypothetical protein
MVRADASCAPPVQGATRTAEREKHMSKRFMLASAACAGVLALAPIAARAQVVINEFQYDDSGTDDREFVELFNSGIAPVDISGWVVAGEDQTAGTAVIGTIPAGTTLAPGAYYVLGQAGVPNTNLTLPVTGPVQNDMETIELRNGTTIVDALVYEVNKGSFSTASLSAQVGPGIWMNHQGVDITGGFLTTTSVARYRDGRDTNNNGRDFGMRPATPGSNNNADGVMTAYQPPDVSSLTHGSAVTGLTGSFVGARAIDPGTVDAVNPNAIPAPNNTSKAIIAWDNSGGGNGVVSNQVFTNSTASFRIQAYLDTNDLPVQSNNANPPVQFRGTEETMFGLLGTVDAFLNLADVSGQVGIGTGSTSLSNGATGNTGIAWYYEKVGISPTGAPVSEKLYLIDANDGGNSNSAGGTTAFDYTVLATIDLSTVPSGWHDMGITVNPDGTGVATFDGQTFNFNTALGLDGAFYVGYRENLQEGAVGVPSYARPATFAVIPEPASLGVLAAAGLLAIRRRR